MPELPEIEALRQSLDDAVAASPIERAEAGHVATLKTIDPPLDALRGERLAGATRRGKRLLFATRDGELVLIVHLMSAGRLQLAGQKKRAPQRPAFRLILANGTVLVLTEPGKRKRAGVWLFSAGAASSHLAHLGPDALEVGRDELERLLAGERHRLHGLLRDQRLIAGIGRAWANEILHAAKLSPFALASELSSDELDRLATSLRAELERGVALREQGLKDERVYRVHRKLARPCHVCGTPIAQIAFEEHTIFYCPNCQTDGRLLADRRLSRLLR